MRSYRLPDMTPILDFGVTIQNEQKTHQDVSNEENQNSGTPKSTCSPSHESITASMVVDEAIVRDCLILSCLKLPKLAVKTEIPVCRLRKLLKQTITKLDHDEFNRLFKFYCTIITKREKLGYWSTCQ